MLKFIKKVKIFSKGYLIPVLLGILIFCIITTWTFYEMVLFGDRTMRIIKQEGQITSKVIKGIIQSQIHSGRISKGRLEYILSNIVDKTILTYVCIKKGENIIFKTSDIGNNFLKTNKNGHKDKIFYFTTKAELEIPPPHIIEKRYRMFLKPETRNRIRKEEEFVRLKEDISYKEHPDEFIDFSRSKQTIIIGINITVFSQQVKSEFKKTLILYIFACIAVIISVIAWIYMLKNNKLKLKYAEMKAKTNKLEELSLAATGLAHEIKNPLGIIRGLTQEISNNSGDKSLIENISEKVIDEADIATERLSDFMNYAKHRTPTIEELEIKEYAEELIDMLQYELNDKNINIVRNITDLKIKADREFLSQIIINILMNSINACSYGDCITFYVCVKNNSCIITISDNGPGIEEKLKNEVFKPYISGNPKGHGIGLAIVKKLVDELDWKIEMESELDKGTKTIISDIKID